MTRDIWAVHIMVVVVKNVAFVLVAGGGKVN
jgi:hypothetical protein